MRRSNVDDSFDLNEMPYLCEESKSYIELSLKKEFTYHTPPSSPRRGTLYIPETHEEVYSCYKDRRPLLFRARSVRAEVLGSFDPQLHGVLKSLFPTYLGKPSPTKCEGFSSSKGDNKIVGVELTSCSLEGKAVDTAATNSTSPPAANSASSANASASNSVQKSELKATSAPSQTKSIGIPVARISVGRHSARSASSRCIRF